MHNAILTQCTGCLASQAFTNGILLVYFSSLAIASTRIVELLSLLTLADAFFRIPLALLADRHGKRRVGLIGMFFIVVGFSGIALAGSLPKVMQEGMIIGGILCFTLGISLMGAGWFAMLSPIVPESLRGRFFGALRFSWQSCAIGFSAICAFFLSRETPVYVQQGVLAVIVFFLIVRIYFYAQIPELEMPDKTAKRKSLRELTGIILRTEGFSSFCAYVFLLALVTAGCPAIFGLVEKRVLGLGDNVVVWLGSTTMIGAVLGYLFGGKSVDRWGTKPVFVVCHFAYGLLLFSYVGRGFFGNLSLLFLFVVHALFGLIQASSSIALSTELLALVPLENKSFSTSINQGLLRLGMALSGLVCAWSIRLGALKSEWQLGGHRLSAYDTVLIAYAVMVMLLVVTLGLVPSVIGKSRLMPQGS